ncbi:adenosine-specific kinase [Cuniculiplasma divulgatum]|jgi:adenosine/AMP kinase|uniref:Predicted adenosine-specific kinase n=1 Tax=Cuniculiplasma divulgatum TaxID=1673428 RepID=A0A1N5UEH3_9ARCH|nr:adenosine-specific kinase [Cuniculiplasma divulgatum]EQB69903.1 MAG: hypothetical protein AMDU5_GPLC00001G0121 [Thermoplasmatales archaeon Gpl]MCI2411848.1 adenosine-specific kinase [Cuniculiplasma sp.]WMT49036.1 MAG: adenosine-specific kinase [Thermoplasmatales archaeon]SIM58329.1 predicted adenosine-specific kinase [Cuniculiplasma divulgatum]
MENIDVVDLENPKGCNLILGYSHFIKTVEDLEEIIKTYIPKASYSITFSEASGDRLVRFESNDPELEETGIKNILNLKCGHTFLILIRDAFPITVLNAIKNCQEVGSVFAATANPISAIVFRGKNGGAILGVIDGFSPLGVETEEDKRKRREFLRNIGYKR